MTSVLRERLAVAIGEEVLEEEDFVMVPHYRAADVALEVFRAHVTESFEIWIDNNGPKARDGMATALRAWGLLADRPIG